MERDVRVDDRSELRLLRCGLRGLCDVPALRAPEGRRLRVLQLHGNALSSLRDLDAICPVLEELSVSSNDLQSLEGLQNLQKLRLLDISCNCLTKLEGIGSLRCLQELRAAYNQISVLTPLLALRPGELRVLDLRDNAVAHLGELLFLGGLPLQDVRFQAAGGRRGNPICRMPGYRAAVLQAAPEARYLDEEVVGSYERDGLLRRPALPESWPPQKEDTAQAEAQNHLQLLREEIQQVEAARGAACRPEVREAAEVPKVSQQLQQELRLVGAEARRRQAMNRELKAKLKSALEKLRGTKANGEQLRQQSQDLELRAESKRLLQSEAAAEAARLEASWLQARRASEEEAAQVAQETSEAARLLEEIEEETEAVAKSCAELQRVERQKVLVKARRQELVEESGELFDELVLAEAELARCRSRCLAEASACDTALQLAEATRKSLELQAEATAEAQEQREAQRLRRGQEEEELRRRRSLLEEEVRQARDHWQGLCEQQQLAKRESETECLQLERRFRQSHLAVVEEGRSLQEELRNLAALAAREDETLRRQAASAEECQKEEAILEDAQREAQRREMKVQEHLASEDLAFQRAEEALRQAQAEYGKEEQQLKQEEASLMSDYVQAQLLEEEEELLDSLKRQREKTQLQLQTTEFEEHEAVASLASSSTDRLRAELGEVEAWGRSVASEFQEADEEMDSMQRHLQGLQDKITTHQEALSRRDRDWQRADAQVRGRLREALAEEEAAGDAVEALQEELERLHEESQELDDDLDWLEEHVEEATEAWSQLSTRRAEDLETEGLREAREAEQQLASLGVALSKELQKHREANQKLKQLADSEEEEMQGHTREERAMQEAWNMERQSLAEEAAEVAAELQRFANGPF